MSAPRHPAGRSRPRRNPGSVTLVESPLHRGSHARLLDRVDAATAPVAEFDAIIVPTSRPAKCLREAIGLAHDLSCLLIAVCSKSSTAREVVAVGEELDAAVLAIDSGDPGRLQPSLETSQLVPEPRLHARTSDLSTKRNLGLLLAHVVGWKRVLFLDDDIARGRLADIRAAAGLLARYDVVGLRNDGFPDNSVVCHAYREAGGEQATFVGGGAMAVAPGRLRSFFPDIYSEDWHFLHGALEKRRVAVSGQVFQKAYDPFADPRRAELEELGDCLGEGLYRLLGDGRGAESADLLFWRDFLRDRLRLIDWVLQRLRRRSPGEERDKMIASIEAARGVSSFVTPKLCRDFVHAWQADLERWRRHLASFPAAPEIEKGLAELGLAGRYARSR